MQGLKGGDGLPPPTSPAACFSTPLHFSAIAFAMGVWTVACLLGALTLTGGLPLLHGASTSRSML